MSLSAWMSDKEVEWRERLGPVKLVVETNFSAHEVRETQKRYGAAARGLLHRDWTHEQFIKRFPALTLLVLVGHASLAYDQGKYWESFWDELRLPQDQDFENAIRKRIVPLLDKFELARFPSIENQGGFKYVMMLALHAGIPIHCLGDLLRLINDHIAHGRVATGAAVIEYLEEPGKEYRAKDLDVPVRNFLVNGAEFAVDILDRIIEFVEATTVDPTLFDLQLDASTTGLPDVLLDELIELLREAPLLFERKRLTARTCTQPVISYLVDDDEIVLTLPVPSADRDLPWRVSFDGDVRDVHATRKWGGEGQPARVPVPAPVREIVLSHPSAPSAALSVVVKDDPMLTFDTGGRWVSRRDGLKDCVWAVVPDHYMLTDARSVKPVEARDVGAPAGWRGWRSAFVELDDVTALQLRSADGTAVGTERWVRKDARPTFDLGEPIAGVLTVDGRTVYSSGPWVLLPPAQTEPGPRWNIRIRRVGESEWLLDETWDAEHEETYVDPFEEIGEPQLGLFEIIVTGPLGADARCVLFVADGLFASFDTPIRVSEADGLTRCVAEITAEAFSIDPAEPIEFGPRRLDVQVDLHTGDNVTKLLVRPPHIQIRTGEVGSPAPWRMTAEVCDPEDFSQDRFVAVRAPGVESVTFSYLSRFGDVLQVDPSPRRRQGNVFETSIQRFADTVRIHPGGRIVATLATEAGPIEVTALSAQPRQLASGVHLEDDRLRFVDSADLSDLAVYVWSSTAPWLPPAVLPVTAGVAELPSSLIDVGDLRCQLFVDDPWVVIERPPTPPETAFRVEQLGWREDGPRHRVQLSRYLGTVCKAPLDVGVVPEVWAALGRLYSDGKMDRFHGLIELLGDDSRRALECLGDSTIPAGDKMAMLVRSEIVNHNYSAEDTLNDLHSHPWFGCMVELADLPSLHQRRAEVRDERAQTLAYLRDRGGAPLMDLLRTGKNTCAFDACFDENIFAMASLPGNPVEGKLREIQQVPLAQLHPENLRAAVYEAFGRRGEWIATGWSENFAQQMSLVTNPIRKKSQLAYDAIEARRDRVSKIDAFEHPWILMSVQSLTLAVLARLEAHGKIGGQYLNRGLLGDWARLAQLCPTMVANDLLIAEALVLYDRRGDLTGEDE